MAEDKQRKLAEELYKQAKQDFEEADAALKAKLAEVKPILEELGAKKKLTEAFVQALQQRYGFDRSQPDG